MTTRSRFINGILSFFDSVSFETVRPMAPLHFKDDFLYQTLNVTDFWTAIDVSVSGLTTPAVVADAGNGVARFPLDVTSEAQESGLTQGNQRCLVLNQGLIWEARIALSTLPTLLGIAVWGLAGDKNAVANTVAESIWFRANGDGVILVESDDGTLEQNSIATGVTVTAGQYKIYRIDCTNIADIKFYIDGNRVASSTTFSMATVPTLALQSYIHIAKASGAGLGVLDCDFISFWQKRAA